MTEEPKKVSYRSAEEIANYRKNWWRSEEAEGIQRKKTAYPRVFLSELPDRKCPIGEPFAHCIHCDFTDKIGVCAYPVNIQQEIEAGRASPYVQ